MQEGDQARRRRRLFRFLSICRRREFYTDLRERKKIKAFKPLTFSGCSFRFESTTHYAIGIRMKWHFVYFRSLSQNALFPKMKNTNRNHEWFENFYGSLLKKNLNSWMKLFLTKTYLFFAFLDHLPLRKLFPGLYIIMEITKYLF